MSAVDLTGLTIDFPGVRAEPAVRELSLSVQPGSSLGIVGESGSGKSLALRAIMGILPAAARVLGGELTVDGRLVPLTGHRDRARSRAGYSAGRPARHARRRSSSCGACSYPTRSGWRGPIRTSSPAGNASGS